MCIGKVEHMRYLFFKCNFTKECLKQIGLNCDMWNMDNSHEWVLHTLANGSDDELIKISSVLLGVWFARNKRIFENKNMTPASVISWSGKQIIEWQLANKKY